MIAAYHSFSPVGKKTAITSPVSYNHEIASVGGYMSAEIVFYTDIVDAEDWFYTGNGRHIDVYSRKGNKVWEGFVNLVSIRIGGREINSGPLLELANRIKVSFTYPNYGVVGDPLAGKYAELDWVDHDSSQVRFGVLEEYITGGSGELEEMEELRDYLIEKKSTPKIAEILGGESSLAQVEIILQCAGYVRMLERQIYTREWEADLPVVDLSEKIGYILDVNKYFVDGRTITRSFETIGIDVAQEEEKHRTAWAIISDHINKSSFADEVLCGMYEDMTLTLNRMDDSVIYKRKAGSSIIQDAFNNDIEPSEIVPGGMMMMTDFSIPVLYRVTSARYDMVENMTSINFREGSLRALLSKAMLGGMIG